MNDRKDSTPKAKDPEEEIIEALPEEAREALVAIGKLVPITNDDGTVTYQIPSGFNRLSTKNCQW